MWYCERDANSVNKGRRCPRSAPRCSTRRSRPLPLPALDACVDSNISDTGSNAEAVRTSWTHGERRMSSSANQRFTCSASRSRMLIGRRPIIRSSVELTAANSPVRLATSRPSTMSATRGGPTHGHSRPHVLVRKSQSANDMVGQLSRDTGEVGQVERLRCGERWCRPIISRRDCRGSAGGDGTEGPLWDWPLRRHHPRPWQETPCSRRVLIPRTAEEICELHFLLWNANQQEVCDNGGSKSRDNETRG